MSVIERLWVNGNAPIHDGLYITDGRSYLVEIDDQSPTGMRIGDAFDLAEWLADNPDWLANIHVGPEAGIDGVPGSIFGGEGGWGSEGYIGRLGGDEQLDWLLYFEDSNPFFDIVVHGSVAMCTSTSGVSVRVDIDSPELPAS